MKKLILIVWLFSMASLAYSENDCTDLVGVWEGAWHEPNKQVRDTQVIFTNIEADGAFKGYYIFIDSPQTTIDFSGKCVEVEGEFEQLSFKPESPKFNICIGVHNSNKELWLGCPFIHVGGVYLKQEQRLRP